MKIRNYLVDQVATSVTIDGQTHLLADLISGAVPDVYASALDLGWLVVAPASVSIVGQLTMVLEQEVISQTEARNARIAAIAATAAGVARITSG